MKLVIDSNQLNNPKLEQFLEKSPRNFAILCEFVSMEIYKGNSIKKIFKSMEILSKFPNQVIILKGARKLSILNARQKGLQRRFVDDSATGEFKGYLSDLKIAASGDIRYRNAVMELSQYANEHFNQMLIDVDAIKDSIITFSKSLTKAEKGMIRKNEFYIFEIVNKIVNATCEISAEFVANSNFGVSIPTMSELPYTYYYRVILSSFLMGIVRGAEGEIKSVQSDKFRNDMVDMSIAATATFFDGIMSDDKRLIEMYAKICRVLNFAFQVELPRQLRS
jgi:hypothetical protein